MKVYRYASEKELNEILNGNIDKVGHTFIRNKSNTHKYKKNVKYLHFFKNFNSIDEIRGLRKNYPGKFYICEYDIPMLVLMLGRGIGFYTPRGYDDYAAGSHVEYIVPNSAIKANWLKNYILDNKKVNVLQVTN